MWDVYHFQGQFCHYGDVANYKHGIWINTLLSELVGVRPTR